MSPKLNPSLIIDSVYQLKYLIMLIQLLKYRVGNPPSHLSSSYKSITLSMARLDTQHPLASGNKFYKLKPHFEFAKQQGITQLISFGGAYSNHIHALALFAKQQGLQTVGIIRGEAEYADNPTLQDVQKAGMQLHFVNREEYRLRFDKDYLENLQQHYPDALIIPEGGSSQLAIAGCAKLAQEINQIDEFDVLCVACGTGATFAGLINGISTKQTAMGYAALKDKTLSQRVETFLSNDNIAQKNNYRIEKADFGGFAKLDKSLLEFVFDWLEQTGILLDPIYTSKMCMRLVQQIEAGEFKDNSSICIIHSGGLQGWRGMQQRVTHLMGNKKWQQLSRLLN